MCVIWTFHKFRWKNQIVLWQAAGNNKLNYRSYSQPVLLSMDKKTGSSIVIYIWIIRRSGLGVLNK